MHSFANLRARSDKCMRIDHRARPDVCANVHVHRRHADDPGSEVCAPPDGRPTRNDTYRVGKREPAKRVRILVEEREARSSSRGGSTSSRSKPSRNPRFTHGTLSTRQLRYARRNEPSLFEGVRRSSTTDRAWRAPNLPRRRRAPPLFFSRSASAVIRESAQTFVPPTRTLCDSSAATSGRRSTLRTRSNHGERRLCRSGFDSTNAAESTATGMRNMPRPSTTTFVNESHSVSELRTHVRRTEITPSPP